jgi:hypothetical protein
MAKSKRPKYAQGVINYGHTPSWEKAYEATEKGCFSNTNVLQKSKNEEKRGHRVVLHRIKALYTRFMKECDKARRSQLEQELIGYVRYKVKDYSFLCWLKKQDIKELNDSIDLKDSLMAKPSKNMRRAIRIAKEQAKESSEKYVDEKFLEKLAERYKVDVEELRKRWNSYKINSQLEKMIKKLVLNRVVKF